MRYIDTNGNVWDSAELALEEFLSDLPYLSEEETETVFQFTRHDADAATNLQAIAYGITYVGMDERFAGDNYPVPTPAQHSQTVGDMGIVVSLHSEGPDAYGENRQTYAYTITHGRRSESGTDLHTGVGLYSDARTMFATLCAFLSAYGEAYRANHLSFNESYADIPAWLQEACYLNSDELGMARFDIEGFDGA